MFIEPNAFDRLVIWDNILDDQQKRQVLRLVMSNSETQRHMKLKRSFEMSDETKSLVLEGLGIYSKSGYFESKVYPRYVKYIKKTVNNISHYELLNAIIPEWVDAEFNRFERESSIWGEYQKTQHLSWKLNANVNTISGRIAFYVCNESLDFTKERYRIYRPRDLALVNMHPSYDVKYDQIKQKHFVDSSILHIANRDLTALRNTIFKYSFGYDEVIPNHEFQCVYDRLHVWVQYMILFDPLPIIKKVENNEVTTQKCKIGDSEKSEYKSNHGKIREKYL